MTKVYEQHDKAFQNVSAYVVLDKNGEHVASVKFKFPRDGAGRLYAYVHWMGTQMVRGSASGYGYDKRSAAVASAVPSIEKANGPEIVPNDHHDIIAERARVRKEQEKRELFVRTLVKDGGEYWDTRLRNAGFTVIQAV
jgi:hypothetical protein